MFGKSLIAIGKKNSMNGTIRKNEKGTRRNISPVVRTNCFRSRRLSGLPPSTRRANPAAVLISDQNNLKPNL